MKRARSDADKDARRQALLQAALNEFYEKGFFAARMDDIAARAELTKGTLYLYFKNKESLFQALIESIGVANANRIEELLAQADSLRAALTVITHTAPMLLKQSKLPMLMKVLVADSVTFPDTVRAYREQVVERVLAALSDVLRRAHERGEAQVPEPALTARLVVAPVVMSALWSLLAASDEQAPAVDLEALFELHHAHLCRALAIAPDGVL